ncbi:MAG: prepilin-type N-terminal cleavage/methylation domain-containing protein [Elusimicrobiota bacterium]|nr:prepilin-type N-terminal cleavage/methylation domain-containing protein [Elusimicrobiota bacterium]
MRDFRKRLRGGFTLIELMIVVAIIGILAAIAVPKFADLISKSREGATKANLASVRSAIKIYYADAEGIYPGDNLACLTANGKYLKEVPQARVPGRHSVSNKVCTGMYFAGGCITGLGAVGSWDGHNNALWIYWEQDAPPMMGVFRQKGDFWVGCNHLDSKGTGWSTF